MIDSNNDSEGVGGGGETAAIITPPAAAVKAWVPGQAAGRRQKKRARDAFQEFGDEPGNFGNFAGHPQGGEEQPFPLHRMPPDIADFVIQAAEAAAVPASMAAVSALGVLAASLGSGLELRDEGSRTTRGNLYLLASVPSSWGKDAVFNEVVGPFTWFDDRARELWQEERKPRLETDLILARHRRAEALGYFTSPVSDETREHFRRELILATAECDRLKRELGRCPKLCVTEPTRVGMAMLLESQQGESCAIMTPEGRGSVEIMFGRGSGGGSASTGFYCAAFSGSSYDDPRATRAAVHLARPCLTVLLMVQVDVLSGLLDTKRMVDSGLLPRFLPFQLGDEPVPEPEVRSRVAKDVKVAWLELVHGLIKEFRLREKEPAFVNAGEDALREFRAFGKEAAARSCPGGDLADIAPFARRWAEQAKRVALGLHAGLHGKEAAEHGLSAATARDAIEVLRWFGGRQLELLHSRRFAWMREKAEQLHKTLQRHPDRHATVGELSKSHGWPKEQVLQLAGLFPDLLRVEETPPGTRGKPTVRVHAL